MRSRAVRLRRPSAPGGRGDADRPRSCSRPDQFSAELRDRILAVAADLGSVGPDPAARALARGSTGVPGVVFTTELRIAFSDDVAAAFLGAIVDGLAPSGLSLALPRVSWISNRSPASRRSPSTIAAARGRRPST